MVERFIFLIIASALGYGLYQLVKWNQFRKARLATQEMMQVVSNDTADSGAASETGTSFAHVLPKGVPALVYFTTPTCAPCRLQQTPILQTLAHRWGDRLHIVRIDATEYPELASKWGVFSVPTTFVLDSHGETQHVHNGVVAEAVLTQQLGFTEAA